VRLKDVPLPTLGIEQRDDDYKKTNRNPNSSSGSYDISLGIRCLIEKKATVNVFVNVPERPTLEQWQRMDKPNALEPLPRRHTFPDEK